MRSMKILRRLLASLAITGVALIGLSAHAGTITLTAPVCPDNIPAGGDAACTDLLVNNSGTPTTITSTPFLVVNVGDSGTFAVSNSFNSDVGGVPGCRSNLTIPAGGKCRVDVNFTPASVRFNSVTYAWMSASGFPRVTLSKTSVAAGTLSLSVPSCPNTSPNVQVSCGTVRVTAVGGPIDFNSPFTTYQKTGTQANQFVTSTPSGATRCGNDTEGVMATGTTCDLMTLSYKPTAYGAHSFTLTATPRAGGNTAVTVSAEAAPPFGTAVVNASGVTCSGTQGLPASCSGTASITASGGPVDLNAAPIAVSGSQSGDFSIPAGACAGASLVSGASCNLGTITFTASATGTRSATLTSSVANGTSDSDALTGTGVAPGAANVTSVSCGNAGIGTTKTCSGTISVSASGGAIKLGTTPYALSGDTALFNDTPASSGACGAGQVLASGASCNLITVSQYSPTAAGADTLTVTVTPAIGTADSGSITGTGTYGTATVSVAGVSCSGTVGVAASCSGTATITATNGRVILNATPVTLSGTAAADFVVAAGTCASANLATGTSCNIGTITFTAGAAGTRSATLTSSVANGTADADTLSGTGAGAGAASVSAVSCGNAGIGTTKACAGTISVTATGGNVKLGTTTHTVSGATSQFTYAAAATSPCSASQVLASGASCNLITVSQFKPTSAGTQTLTVNVSPASGTADSGTVTGAGTYGTATVNVSAVSCSGTVGLSATCSGAATITATNGQVVLNATPVALSGTMAADFSVGAGACASANLASGASCNLGTITFTAGAAGTRSATVTSSVLNGSADSDTLSGTGAGVGSASVNSIPCGSTGIGTTKACSGTIAVTATGGTIKLASTPSAVTGNGSQFTYAVAATNVCVANQVLASGESCNLRTVSQYNPTVAGAHTLTITVTPTLGAADSGTITGTATYGTATISTTGVVCSGTHGIPSNCSGTATITATNGQVVLNATPVVVSGTHASDFSVAAGACAGANLSNGTSCNLGTITFTAGASSGTRTAILSSSVASGTADSDTLNGTPTGAGTATVSTVSCGNAGVGTTASCSGTVSVTASGGNIQLHSTPYTVSGATSQFTYAAAGTGACTPSQVLASGTSCNLITVTQFKPTAAGTQTMTVAVAPWAGAPGSNTVTGTGTYGTASLSTAGVSCTGNVGVAASCTGSIVVAATGGQITLGTTIFTKSGTNAADFSIATTAAGACTASQTLASGASCNLGPITFTASGGGSRTATVTVTPTNGTAGNATLTGTASYGTATVSVAGVSCSSTTGLSATCTGTATISATGGQVILNATPVSLSGTHAADFSVVAGACASATLASGASCNLGTITFTPGAAGSRSVTLTSSAANGTNASANLTGTGVAAGAASVSNVSCSPAGIGTTASCPGSVVVSASGGAIKLGSTLYAVAGSTTEFTTAAATGTNACSPNQVLASGSACIILTVSQFKPTSAGLRTMTVTVTPAIGTADSGTVTGTGAYGTANITGTVSCSGFIGVQSACTGTLTVTATNGRIVLATPAFDLSGTNAADFSVATGSCTAGLSLNNGASCTLGTVSFNAGGVGARTATLRVAPANGSQDTVTLSGNGNWGTASVSSSSINCGSIGAGLSKSCSTFTMTAQSGRIQLAALPLTNTNTADFQVLLGQCVGNTVLDAGESCTTGAITFHPSTVGARAATIQVVLTNGNGPAVSLSGTGLSGAASAAPGVLNCGTATVGSSSSCGAVTVTATGGPITLSATPLSAGGVFSVAPGTCTAGKVLAVNTTCTTGAVTFSPSAAGTSSGTLSVNCGAGCTDTVSLTGIGYAYAWSTDNWGSCTGGSGTWQLGAWEPAQGCGMTTQSRETQCAANAGSATQARAVTCMRSDGTGTIAVDDALCADPKPNVSQSCTPTSGFSCGTQPATTQSVELTNTCSYAWQAREWAAWDSTCSENATRTRVVECERSDGTIVDNASCSGTKPTASETQEVLTSCTFSWIASGFDACAGGTFSWATGTWGPTMGCGAVEQTRQVVCAVDVNSGTHSQSVGCRRSDGVDVFASFCDAGTRPATTEACTPAQSVCVDSPSNTQTVTLDTSCVRDAILSGCQITADHPFCVAVPL